MYHGKLEETHCERNRGSWFLYLCKSCSWIFSAGLRSSITRRGRFRKTPLLRILMIKIWSVKSPDHFVACSNTTLISQSFQIPIYKMMASASLSLSSCTLRTSIPTFPTQKISAIMALNSSTPLTRISSNRRRKLLHRHSSIRFWVIELVIKIKFKFWE